MALARDSATPDRYFPLMHFLRNRGNSGKCLFLPQHWEDWALLPLWGKVHKLFRELVCWKLGWWLFHHLFELLKRSSPGIIRKPKNCQLNLERRRESLHSKPTKFCSQKNQRWGKSKRRRQVKLGGKVKLIYIIIYYIILLIKAYNINNILLKYHKILSII